MRGSEQQQMGGGSPHRGWQSLYVQEPNSHQNLTLPPQHQSPLHQAPLRQHQSYQPHPLQGTQPPPVFTFDPQHQQHHNIHQYQQQQQQQQSLPFLPPAHFQQPEYALVPTLVNGTPQYVVVRSSELPRQQYGQDPPLSNPNFVPTTTAAMTFSTPPPQHHQPLHQLHRAGDSFWPPSAAVLPPSNVPTFVASPLVGGSATTAGMMINQSGQLQQRGSPPGNHASGQLPPSSASARVLGSLEPTEIKCTVKDCSLEFPVFWMYLGLQFDVMVARVDDHLYTVQPKSCKKQTLPNVAYPIKQLGLFFCRHDYVQSQFKTQVLRNVNGEALTFSTVEARYVPVDANIRQAQLPLGSGGPKPPSPFTDELVNDLARRFPAPSRGSPSARRGSPPAQPPLTAARPSAAGAASDPSSVHMQPKPVGEGDPETPAALPPVRLPQPPPAVGL